MDQNPDPRPMQFVPPTIAERIEHTRQVLADNDRRLEHVLEQHDANIAHRQIALAYSIAEANQYTQLDSLWGAALDAANGLERALAGQELYLRQSVTSLREQLAELERKQADERDAERLAEFKAETERLAQKQADEKAKVSAATFCCNTFQPHLHIKVN